MSHNVQNGYVIELIVWYILIRYKLMIESKQEQLLPQMSTCQGLSQSSGIGQAPNHEPIIAPYAGRMIMQSSSSIGL